MPRKFNFSAGPSTLPEPVLQKAQEEMLDFGGTGVGVMEMSHRSTPFESILQAAETDLRTLLEFRQIIVFCSSRRGEPSALDDPDGFRGTGPIPEYVVTGSWGEKAVEAARIGGSARVIWSGAESEFSDSPRRVESAPDPAYVHVTTNKTIQGVALPEGGIQGLEGKDVVADMSSDILSRPIDVSKYALIYAGAQKNMGPAGLTVVILRDDFLEKSREGLPPMLDYRVHVKNGSMYNTPPTWSIYITGLVLKHLLEAGGLREARRRNEEKARLIYEAIDQSNGFYRGHATITARSLMNVTFTLPSEELTKRFLREADALGLDGLKGHRSVGGCRASIYNAFPLEGCQRLADFMRLFAR